MNSDTWERPAAAPQAAPPRWGLILERLTAAARLVYRATSDMLEPFVGLTRNPQLDGMVLEINAMIALLVVALIGWAVARGLELLFPPTGFPEI